MKRDAFISYSHKRDVALAEALQDGLQGFLRTPWLHRPGARIFRDTTSLGASPDLSSSIKDALRESRYFIYLASPEAAKSRWVREEIKYWCDAHGVDRFLIALSSGRIEWDPVAGDFDWDCSSALPPDLKGVFTTEPLWVDLREFSTAEDRSMAPGARFRGRVASLAAALHGIPKDALDSADLRRQRKAVRILRSFVAGLSVLLLVAVGSGIFAWQQYREALDRARTSASQALAARALDMTGKDSRKAAQFALYAQAVQPTGESAQALAQAFAANSSVARHLQVGNEGVANFLGAGNVNATNVAISRNGSRLAYYSDFDPDTGPRRDRHIHLYDLGAGKALPNLEDGEWPRNGGGIQFSSDGRTLAVEEPYDRIAVWDVSRQKRIRTITATSATDLATALLGLRAFAFSGDAKRLAATYYASGQPEEENLHAAVWDVTTGRRILDEKLASDSLALGFDDANRLHALDFHDGATRTLPADSTVWSGWRKIPGFPRGERQKTVFSADGSRVYVGEKREIWDLTEGRRLAAAGSPDTGPVSMPGGKDAAVYAADGREVGVYDGALHRRRVLGSFTWPVLSIAASGDGQWVAAGSGDGAVSLFSADGMQVGNHLANEPHVKSAELAPDNRTAFRVGRTGTDVWSATGKGLRKLGRIPLRQTGKSPVTVTASLDGRRAVTAQEGVLSLWDLRHGSRVGKTPALGDEFVLLAYLSDGVHVVGTTRTALQVVDPRSWDIVHSVPFDGDAPSSAVSLSADRTTLAVATDEELAALKWDEKAKELEQVRKVSAESVWTGLGQHVVASSPGERVAMINFDGIISVLDVTTGRFVHGSSASNGGTVLAFSSDDTFLLQSTKSGKDRGLQFWDAATVEPRGAWTLPQQGTGRDGTVGALLTGADGTVTALGTDGSLVRQTVDVAAWQKALCDLHPDELPAEEYQRYLGSIHVDAPCRH